MKRNKTLLVGTAVMAMSLSPLIAGDSADSKSSKHVCSASKECCEGKEKTMTSADKDKSMTSMDKSKGKQAVRLSSIMDTQVTSRSGENLGELQDLIVNPQTGEIQYAVLGSGGGTFGMRERLVPIPWKAISVKSEKQFTINVDKQKLMSAPTTDSSYRNMSDPGYTVTIHRFFLVPVDAGAAESPGGSEQGSDSSSKEQSTSSEQDSESSSDKKSSSSKQHSESSSDKASKSSSDEDSSSEKSE